MTGDRVHGEGVLWLFCPLTPAGAENQGQLRPCHRAARSTPKDQRVWLGMPGEGTGDKGALGPAEELGCPAMRGHRAHSLLFSFMNVHMSLSSGLCAKEQFPTYWHLRPFWAWMQSCGVGGGQCAESCWTMSPSQLEGEPSGALWSPQPEVRPPPCRTSPPALTSYCCGKLRMDGNGLTDTHFLLALDITRRTRRSLVQLQGRVGGAVGVGLGRVSSCVTSTEGHRLLTWSSGAPRPRRPRPTHQCWALALQYLRSLSGSTTCPFLQHWPHTNFICRSKVLGPCVLGAPCGQNGRWRHKHRGEALGSTMKVASGGIRAAQSLGMGHAITPPWRDVTCPPVPGTRPGAGLLTPDAVDLGWPVHTGLLRGGAGISRGTARGLTPPCLGTCSLFLECPFSILHQVCSRNLQNSA